MGRPGRKRYVHYPLSLLSFLDRFANRVSKKERDKGTQCILISHPPTHPLPHTHTTVFVSSSGNEAKLLELKERARALLEWIMSVRKDVSNDAVARAQRLESMMM